MKKWECTTTNDLHPFRQQENAWLRRVLALSFRSGLYPLALLRQIVAARLVRASFFRFSLTPACADPRRMKRFQRVVGTEVGFSVGAREPVF